jgi:hypothetical protein
MNRVLFALAAMLAMTSLASAQQTKTQMNTYNNNNIGANGSNSITGPVVNNMNNQMINSMCGLATAADCVLPPGVVEAAIGGTVLHTANLAGLQAYTKTGVSTVYRDGYAVAGDGGGAFYVASTATCAAQGLTNDGGFCVNSSVSGSWLLAGQRWSLNPAIFGAIPNTVELFATVTSIAGNACVTIAGANFASADVGKLIRIEAIGANERWFNGAITSVTDATHVCLSANATQGVTAYAGQHVIYGSDLAANMQAAFTVAAGTGRGAYVSAGHYLVGSALICPIPATSISYSNNFQEPPALCDMQTGATISYVGGARIGAVVTYGSDNSNFTGYIQTGRINGGTVDCGFNANYAQDAPFFNVLVRSFVNTKNCMHAGMHAGSQASPLEGGGLTDTENNYIREISSVPVTTCTTGSAVMTCTTAQPHGFCNQGRTKQPVVAITGATISFFSTDWFRVTCPSATTFTIQGVNGAAWGAWSGTASASLTIPSMRVPQGILGITQANPAVINVADTSDMVTGDKIHIAENIGLTSGSGKAARKCVDGVYPLTVVNATNFSIPVDATGCTAYSTGGFAEQWVDPIVADACVFSDKASDMNYLLGTCQGVRFGFVHNPSYSGYDGKIIGTHFYNYAQHGSIFAAAYVGGKTRVSDLQVDTPAKYGVEFVGGYGNSVSGMEINGDGFGNGTWMRDNYTALVRMSANAAEGGVAGRVNIRDGVLTGAGGGLLAAYARSSNFPFTIGVDIYGDVVGVDQSVNVQDAQVSTFGEPNGTVGFSKGLTVFDNQFIYSFATAPGTVDAGIQLSGTGQAVGLYTNNTYRGAIEATGLWDSIVGFSKNGVAGFSGTKTAGSCVITYSGGIVTNVTGC